tara:strand:- start:309 stop:695 length:387 start_codon:yes stop_codon:yes gene_type:complete
MSFLKKLAETLESVKNDSEKTLASNDFLEKHDYIFKKGERFSIYEKSVSFLDIVVFFRIFLPWLDFNLKDFSQIDGYSSHFSSNFYNEEKEELYNQLIKVLFVELDPYRMNRNPLLDGFEEPKNEQKH